ncbi:hypothetical protein E4T39_03051 [Aureobasidium subglaciale]|nr:hypothetical protein E4T39_03051 [Aureobasidium subglaciale]
MAPNDLYHKVSKSTSYSHLGDTRLPLLPYQHSWEISELLKTIDAKENRRWRPDPVYVPTLPLLLEGLEEENKDEDEICDDTEETYYGIEENEMEKDRKRQSGRETSRLETGIDDTDKSSKEQLEVYRLTLPVRGYSASKATNLQAPRESKPLHLPQRDIFSTTIWLLAYTHGLYIWRGNPHEEKGVSVCYAITPHAMVTFWASVIATCARRMRSGWRLGEV